MAMGNGGNGYGVNGEAAIEYDETEAENSARRSGWGWRCEGANGRHGDGECWNGKTVGGEDGRGFRKKSIFYFLFPHSTWPESKPYTCEGISDGYKKTMTWTGWLSLMLHSFIL